MVRRQIKLPRLDSLGIALEPATAAKRQRLPSTAPLFRSGEIFKIMAVMTITAILLIP